MNAEAQRILEQALGLPENERATLAAELLESLDSVVDADAESAWAEEVTRRVAALDSGSIRTIPWSELRRSMLGSRDDESSR